MRTRNRLALWASLMAGAAVVLAAVVGLSAWLNSEPSPGWNAVIGLIAFASVVLSFCTVIIGPMGWIDGRHLGGRLFSATATVAAATVLASWIVVFVVFGRGE